MFHLLLFFVLPLISSAAVVADSYTKQNEFSPKRNHKVGAIDLGSCYGGSMEITPTGTEKGWCNIFHVGDANNQRKPAMWFFPGQTRLHLRTSTDHHYNEGCDLNFQLPQNKKSNVRFFACGRTVRVSVRVEHDATPHVLTCKLKGRVVGGATNLWMGDNHYPACKAKVEDAEIFRALPNVAHDCTKLKTQAAALRAKYLGESSQAEKAVPVHTGTMKSQQGNLADIANIRKLVGSLKTLNAALRTQLTTLLNQLEKSSKDGLNVATQAKADAEQSVSKAKEVVKHLDVNKIHCECTEVKNTQGKKINQMQTTNNGLTKEIGDNDKQIQFLDATKKDFEKQMAMFKGSTWLDIRMKALFTALIADCSKGMADLKKKNDEAAAKKSANEKLIKEYRDEITKCDNKLKEAKAKVFSFFGAQADLDLMSNIDEMDFFEELNFSEAMGANINLDEYVDAITSEEFATEQELEGVETQQVSYGLIGGAGVLTSGIFYYAYQSSKQNSY